MALEFYTSMAKGLKIFGANSYVFRSYKGKTGRGGGFLSPSHHPQPILNRVNSVTRNLCHAHWLDFCVIFIPFHIFRKIVFGWCHDRDLEVSRSLPSPINPGCDPIQV